MGIITSEYGAWMECDKLATKFKRLDNWQDDYGRRVRLVNNPYGSTHPEATLLEALGKYVVKIQTLIRLIYVKSGFLTCSQYERQGF